MHRDSRRCTRCFVIARNCLRAPSCDHGPRLASGRQRGCGRHPTGSHAVRSSPKSRAPPRSRWTATLSRTPREAIPVDSRDDLLPPDPPDWSRSEQDLVMPAAATIGPMTRVLVQGRPVRRPPQTLLGKRRPPGSWEAGASAPDAPRTSPPRWRRSAAPTRASVCGSIVISCAWRGQCSDGRGPEARDGPAIRSRDDTERHVVDRLLQVIGADADICRTRGRVRLA